MGKYGWLAGKLSATESAQRASQRLANYKRALEADPKLAEAHLNLGFAYKQLNASVHASQEYAEACRLEQKFCQFAAP